MNDFATKHLTPSIIHGSAAPEAFATALMDAINKFVSTKNVEKTFKEILMIADDNGYNTK